MISHLGGDKDAVGHHQVKLEQHIFLETTINSDLDTPDSTNNVDYRLG